MREIIFMTLICFATKIAAREVDYCYAEEEDPYLLMATKTAYHFVHGGKTRYQPVANCAPLQIWMLSRHGTRNPDRNKTNMLRALPKLRDQIKYNLEVQGNGHLCEQDLRNLNQWYMKPEINVHNAETLTDQGKEDMKLLARRLQSNFPELLQPDMHDITSANYKFRSTRSQRTKDSMKSFMEGLFGKDGAVHPEEPSREDLLLNSHKDCIHWVNVTKTEMIGMKEQTKFVKESDFQNLLRNVSRRLGFLHNISSVSTLLMYDMCRFEKSIYVSEISPWCAVFNKEELRVLEYHEDVEHYYHSGYGREINKKIGCFPLQDMFNHFRKLERPTAVNEPKGVFYFSHSTTIQSLLVAINMYEDSQKLTAYNYRDMKKRKWQTSYISPFAANFVAIFYKCNDTYSPNKVMFYVQEKPVLYEGCDVGLCDWEYLKNKLGNMAKECDTNFCSLTNGSKSFDSFDLFAAILPALIFSLH